VVNHLDLLEDIGDIPIEMLERILPVCSASQLEKLEKNTV
jgi:hypothetical protein